MNRLYIISKTEDSGSTFATMDLNLSSPQFKVITSLEDCSKVSDGAIIVHDAIHPSDSIDITDLLVSRGALNLRDRSWLMTIINYIYMELDRFNSLYSTYTNEHYSKIVKEKMTDSLISMGFTKKNGFEYQVGRDPRQNFLFIHPQSDRMTVIVNLVKGFINKLRKPIEQIKIYDPKGYFSKSKGQSF